MNYDSTNLMSANDLTFPKKSFLSSLVAEMLSPMVIFESATSSVSNLILPRGAPGNEPYSIN